MRRMRASSAVGWLVCVRLPLLGRQLDDGVIAMSGRHAERTSSLIRGLVRVRLTRLDKQLYDGDMALLGGYDERSRSIIPRLVHVRLAPCGKDKKPHRLGWDQRFLESQN